MKQTLLTSCLWLVYLITRAGTIATHPATETNNFLGPTHIKTGATLYIDSGATIANSGTATGFSSGSGTVTSVAVSVPSLLSISGSPITTSGTLAISYSGTALPIANGGTNSTTGVGLVNSSTSLSADRTWNLGAHSLSFAADDGSNPTVLLPALTKVQGEFVAGSVTIFGGTSGAVGLAVPAISGTGAITFNVGTNTFSIANGTASITVPAGLSGTLNAITTLTPGAGVATALATNAGSAGGIVTVNGALGQPTSGILGAGVTVQLSNVTVTGTLSGSSISGGTFGAVNGSALTALNASNISSGTLADARNTVSNSTTTTMSAVTNLTAAASMSVGPTSGTSKTLTLNSRTSGGVTNNVMVANADGSATFAGNISAAGTSIQSDRIIFSALWQIYQASNTFFFSKNDGTGSIVNSFNLVASGSTASTSSATGAMLSSGGLGVAGDTFLGGTLNVSGAVTQSAKTVRYNGIATTGIGVVPVLGVGRVTAQSAANASIATYTAPASDGSYEVSMNLNVTAVTVMSASLNCDYTDESNTARTMILPVQSLAGNFITGGLVTATGPYETPAMHIRVKASTQIKLYTSAGTYTGVTYTAEGVIKQTQ